MAKLESALSTERCLKEELIFTKDELATKLHTVEETLTAECDKLRTELSETHVQLEASYRSCANLEQSLASEKSDKEVILKEKEMLNCQLVDLKEVMDNMSKEIKEKNDSIVAVQVYTSLSLSLSLSLTHSYTNIFMYVHMHTQTCYQASLNASKSEFEAAQLEWKENQAQLQEQIWTLEGDKTRLEAQTSQLTSQLHEAQSNLEQQEKCSKQDADKVSKQTRHTCV